MNDVETLTGTVASLETKQTTEGVALEFWIESAAARSPARASHNYGGLLREGTRVQVTGKRDHNGVLVADTIRPPSAPLPGWWLVPLFGVPRWMMLAGAVVLGAIVVAVVTNDPPPPQPRPIRVVPQGTVLTVKMSTGLSSQITRMGDRFEATTVDRVISDDGTILLGAGTVLLGSVRSVQQPTLSEGGRMTFDFDGLMLNNSRVAIDVTAVEAIVGGRPFVIRDNVLSGALSETIALDRSSRSNIKPLPQPLPKPLPKPLPRPHRHATISQGDLLKVRVDRPIPLPQRQ